MKRIEKNLESARIIAKIAKFKDQSICALEQLSEKNSNDLNFILKQLDHYNVSKSKPEKKESLFEEDESVKFLKKIKNNISQNYSNSIVQYTPTDINLVNRVESLCQDCQFDQVDSIHSTVVSNEEKSFALQLLESYYRGKIYYHCYMLQGENFPDHFPSIKPLSRSLIYKYKSFYQLVSTYPCLIFSGVGLTEIMKYKKDILKTITLDNEFHLLLTQPFPGFKISEQVMSTSPDPQEEFFYETESEGDNEEMNESDHNGNNDSESNNSENANEEMMNINDYEEISNESEQKDIREAKCKIFLSEKPSTSKGLVEEIIIEQVEEKENPNDSKKNKKPADSTVAERKKGKYSKVIEEIISLRQEKE